MSEENSKKKTIAEREREILEFWRENRIFEKSVEKNDPNNSFVFYDGPPFATGLPHYGHLLQGTIKDVIPRYQTMRGKHVRRVWGWDCHGLPIENIVEKDLDLNSKKEIEEYGIAKFNEAAKESVFRYEEEWKKIVPRLGRWIDMEHPYKTMDWQYTESVWWAFKELFDKGLIYKGYKSMHICPRCETTLANSEVTMNYADVKDISVTVKFELKDKPGTFVLAWTTTPWTLPGNVALAVNPEVEYSICRVGEENLIVAQDLVENIFGGEKFFEVLEHVSGKDLIGKKYTPLFDYYAKDESLENRENGWQIYGADFVQTDSGTGIVHIAPAFGEDDLAIGQAKNLPFVQHVRVDGAFKPEVSDFAGMKVKQKGDTQSADVAIIKKLAADGTLFSKKKIEHSYPLCWRCDTPLLNYAASSWFVKVTDLKKKLISENEKIGWVPETVGKNRFGNWLEGARDWAISRSRYWGAPIPVWECDRCEKQEVIGSLESIKEKRENTNSFFGVRHGESDHNVENRIDSARMDNSSLTEKGKEQVREAAEKLKNEHIDMIYTSPYARTRETANLLAQELDLNEGEIIVDDRIREYDFGEFDGKTMDEYWKFRSGSEDLYTLPTPGGESYLDAKRRVGEFLYEINKEHAGKNILIVSHGIFLEVAPTVSKGTQNKEAEKSIKVHRSTTPGTVIKLEFKDIPHNSDYELDLHRPYIDEVEFSCECGGIMRRIPEVFDCWFESGSMPYGQFHYPFENQELFDQNFPANFIAEAVDQTRGWFYNMLVLSVGLFGKSAFQNVIVSGLVLAEDGQKMSKKLKNYPDPLKMAEKYGADALRYYMLSSPIVRGEELLFSEKGVDDVVKKIVHRLGNVASFYELYKDGKGIFSRTGESENVLDVWILARLDELAREVGESLDAYLVDRAARPIGAFIDDLSTWYVRRSRERFKSEDQEDKQYALETLEFVLLELSKILAPFMPFFAEDIYGRVGGREESVHLEEWPEELRIKNQESSIKEMQRVREIVSRALELRTRAGIKVRQSLSSLRMKNKELSGKEGLLDLIKDEVNVKAVIFDDHLPEEVSLDTEITSELKEEGEARELLRHVQDLRKKAELTPGEEALLEVNTSGEALIFFERHEPELSKTAVIGEVLHEEKTDEMEVFTIGDKTFFFHLRKLARY